MSSRERHVGVRIRGLRQAQGVSANELAKRVGVSRAYLSRVENGHVSPTVASLSKIMGGLGVPVSSAFDTSVSEEGPIVRADERPVILSRGVEDYLLTPTRNGRLEVLETTIEPSRGSGGDYSHPGDEECVIVLDGQFRVWVDGVQHDLSPGDAITFNCRTPHRWENPGEETTRVIWVVTPAGY